MQKITYRTKDFDANGADDLGQPGHKYAPEPTTHIVSDLGYHVGPVSTMDIAMIIAERGGTGPILRDMGYQPGTKEYKTAQRAIERHARGTKAGAAYQERYQKLVGPPAGTVAINVAGEIKKSDDVRARDATVVIRGNSQEILAALLDPVGAWHTQGFEAEINHLTSVTINYQPM